jgi:hypothetical protein
MYKYLTLLLLLIYNSCYGAAAGSYPVKPIPDLEDYVLITDSAAGNALKRAAFSTLPSTESTITDSNFLDTLNNTDYTPVGNVDLSNALSISMGPLIFEGTTVDDFQTGFAITDPTADRVINLGDFDMRIPASSGVGSTGLILDSGLSDNAVKPTVNSKAAAYTVGTDDSKECYNGTIHVTSAAVITACDALATGMNFTVVTRGNIAVSVDTQTDDRMVLDGVALDDGDKATNTSTIGDTIYCEYESAAGWYCWSGSTDGDHWTDGGQ